VTGVGAEKDSTPMIDTIVSLWLAVMLTFARREPRERLESVARTVIAATSDPQEQALLLTVSLYETGFGRRGIPFGISSVNRSNHHTMLDDALASLRILRRSRALCRQVPMLLGHYHHGNGCRPDLYSIREADTVRRMVSLYNREAYIAGAPVAPPVAVYALDRHRGRSRRR
jgi:hypothetical protein